MVTKLDVFDFDLVLFRTPPVSVTVRAKSHIHSEDSLLPPYLPVSPPEKYWVTDTVKAFRKSIRDPVTLSGLITSRREGTKSRILDLLERKGIDPEFSVFRPRTYAKDKDSVIFKRKSIIRLLKLHEDIHTITFWGSSEDDVDSIRDLAKYKKISFEPHMALG